MRASAVLLCLAGALSGCADGTTRVDVTARNGSLDAATLGAIHQLAVAVTGAETFATTYDLTDQLVRGGARWVYLAGVDSGELLIAVDALDGSGAVVGVGAAAVQLRGGKTVDALIALDPPSAGTDGGDGGVDAAIGVDASEPLDAGGDGAVDFAWPSFVPAILYPVPSSSDPPLGTAVPIAVAIGDLDHDTHNDVTFVNDQTTTSQLVRAYQTAPLTYTKYISSFTGFNDVRAVSLFDIDLDGKLDIGMADPTANRVFYVMSGNGYSGSTNFGTTGATALVLGNFNGDAFFDVVVAEPAQNLVVPYIGQSGSFTGQTLASESGPNALAMADLDLDTHPDVVATNGGSDDATVLLWNPGMGSFNPLTFQVGANPTGVALGRLDADAFPDIVVTRADGTVGIYLNALGNGSPSLTAKTPLTAGGGARSPVIGDLDGDGINDVAVANHIDHTLSLFLGKGDGTFAAAILLSVEVAPITPSSSAPNGLAIGNLDGDVRADLAVAADAGVFLFLTHP